MKVLHVVSPVVFGGGESVLVDLSESFKAEGIEVDILLLSKSEPFELELRSRGIYTFSLCDFELKQNSSIMGFLIVALRMLVNLKFWSFPFQNYHVIHCHGFPAVLLPSVKRRIYTGGSKFIYTHHQQVFKGHFLMNVFFKKLYSRFNQITLVSDTIKNRFIDKFNLTKNISTVYNPINDIFFTDNKKHLNCKSLKLIYPARFSKQKAHSQLIDVFENYNFSKELTIDFVGDGELLESARKKVIKKELSEVFRFIGFRQRSWISQELTKYDLAIFPSIYEGFGVAAVECIASGLPVIFNDCNSTLHEIVGKCGWSMPLESIPDFLENLSDEEYLDKRNNCLQQRVKFKVDTIHKNYLKVYSL